MIRNEAENLAIRDYYNKLAQVLGEMEKDRRLPVHVRKTGGGALERLVTFLRKEIELWETQHKKKEAPS